MVGQVAEISVQHADRLVAAQGATYAGNRERMRYRAETVSVKLVKQNLGEKPARFPVNGRR
jgi:hypothetical protein